MYFAGLNHMPVFAFEHNGTPFVAVAVVYFAQGVGKNRSIGEGGLDALDHFLESVNFGGNIFASGFGAFDAQTKLVIFFVADQNIRYGSNLGKYLVQFLFAAFPERSPVVQIERNAGAVFFGHAGKFQAEFAGILRQSAYQAREMYNLYAFLSKNPVEIKIFHVQCTSYFAGTVVPDPGSPRTVTAIGYINLMTIAPGTSLIYIHSFEIHVAAAQVGFDVVSEGTAFYKSGQHFYRQTKDRRNTGHIRFGTGNLQMKNITAMDGLPVVGRNTQTYAGRNKHGILAIFFKFDTHNLLVI